MQASGASGTYAPGSGCRILGVDGLYGCFKESIWFFALRNIHLKFYSDPEYKPPNIKPRGALQ